MWHLSPEQASGQADATSASAGSQGRMPGRGGLEVLAEMHAPGGEGGRSSPDRDDPVAATQCHAMPIMPRLTG